MERQADVVIVGGGIAGVSTAYELAKRGSRVVVCEKGEVGAEQSTRNWGFVRQQGRDPAELPLMMESNKIWQGLERELNADLNWIQAGNLVTFADEQERQAWTHWAGIAADHGLETRVLDRAELGRLVPDVKFDCLGAVYTPSDGQAEATQVMPALHRAAEGRGVTFLTNSAVYEIETAAGEVKGVIGEHGPVHAPVVVCAAGAWSGRLLRQLGLKLPQMWLRGSVARTTAARHISHTATWTGVAYRQRRDGTMNVATRSTDHDLTIDSLLGFRPFMQGYFTNHRGIRLHVGRLFFDLLGGRFSKAAFRREVTRHRILDPAPNMKILNDVLSEVRRIAPAAADVEIERAWAGYIDMTPDLLPAIDALVAPKGLILATGFSGHGFGMGPIVGRLVAELILDGRPSLDLSAFRFSRFHDGTKLTPHTVV